MRMRYFCALHWYNQNRQIIKQSHRSEASSAAQQNGEASLFASTGVTTQHKPNGYEAQATHETSVVCEETHLTQYLRNLMPSSRLVHSHLETNSAAQPLMRTYSLIGKKYKSITVTRYSARCPYHNAHLERHWMNFSLFFERARCIPKHRAHYHRFQWKPELVISM